MILSYAESPLKIEAQAIVAGWGHLITAECVRQGLGLTPVGDNLLFPTDESLQRFNFFVLLHRIAQRRDSDGSDGGILKDLEREIEQSLKTCFPIPLIPVIRAVKPILEGAMNADEDLSKWEKILRDHPMLSIAVTHLLREINYFLFVKQIADDLISQMGNNSFPITTHGLTLGKNCGLNIVLDPGFPFKGAEFDPLNLVAMLPPGKNQIILSPTDFEAGVLLQHHGLEAFNIGTVGQEMDSKEVVSKWQDNQPRIILASTSGNGTNLESLLKIKQDYLIYAGKGDYRLVIFLGEHQESVDPRISQIANQEDAEIISINNEEDLRALSEKITQTQRTPLVIRTADKFLTAKAKLILERLAHVEAVKPGEASFMNPHTATFNYFLAPAGQNESMNGIWSVVDYRSGIFMPDERWDKFLEDFLSLGIYFFLDKLKGEELLSFASVYIHQIKERMEVLRSKDNFFDQMDSLFEDGFAKKTAVEAYCQARNLLVPLKIAIQEVISEGNIFDVKNFSKKLRAKLRKMVETGRIEEIFQEERRKKENKFFSVA